MAEQDDRYARIVIADPVIDLKSVFAEQMPAVPVTKIPELLCVRAVSAVVMRDDGQAATASQRCEPFVSSVVLAKAMEQLNDTCDRAIRVPVGAANAVIVGCFKFQRICMHVCYWRTACDG